MQETSGESGAFLNKIVCSNSVSRFDHRRKKQRHYNDILNLTIDM